MLNYYSDKAEEAEIRKLAESRLKGISKLFNNKKMLIAEGTHKEIFLVSNELFEVYHRMKEKKHPYSIGFYFGEYNGSEIKFSIPAISEYSKISSFHKVIIHPHAEQKFLFGRNLHSEVIVSYDRTLEMGDTVVICNQNNEALGLGIVTGDFKSQTRTQVIKNITDLGEYLRNKE